MRLDTPEVAPHLSGPEYEALKQALRQAARAYLEQPPFYQLCCAGQICLVWHTFFSRLPCRVLTAEEDAKAKKRSARLTRLLEFVDNNYMHPIRLADFAQAEGCTMNYMSYFVRQCLDQAFRNSVETVRFDHACKLIDAGAVRMTDVCFAAGFSDYRYFCRAFRRRLGLTPEEYCRRAQPALQPETPCGPARTPPSGSIPAGKAWNFSNSCKSFPKALPESPGGAFGVFAQKQLCNLLNRSKS